MQNRVGRSLNFEGCSVTSKVKKRLFLLLLLPDRHLREKLLRLGEKRLQAAHEKRVEVSGSGFSAVNFPPGLSLLTAGTIDLAGLWCWTR